MTAAEFAEMADAASPGPWRWNALHDMESATAMADAEFDCEPRPQTIIITDGGFYPPRTADRAFIAACGTERQRIHRALLLLELVEDGTESDRDFIEARVDCDPQDVADVIYALRARINAASKEMETRP